MIHAILASISWSAFFVLATREDAIEHSFLAIVSLVAAVICTWFAVWQECKLKARVDVVEEQLKSADNERQNINLTRRRAMAKVYQPIEVCFSIFEQYEPSYKRCPCGRSMGIEDKYCPSCGKQIAIPSRKVSSQTDNQE